MARKIIGENYKYREEIIIKLRRLINEFITLSEKENENWEFYTHYYDYAMMVSSLGQIGKILTDENNYMIRKALIVRSIVETLRWSLLLMHKLNIDVEEILNEYSHMLSKNKIEHEAIFKIDRRYAKKVGGDE